MSDWSDFGIGADWTSGFDLPGGGDIAQWIPGYDLPGGGDTGLPVGPGATFDVGPGQIPSDIYQQLLALGGLGPGFSTSIPGGGAGGGGLNINASNLLKGLGYDPASGGLDLLRFLSLLAPLASGFMTSDAARKSTNEMADQIKAANAMLGGYVSDAQARYAPYITGGQNAFTQAANTQWNPLAPRFPALGTPATAMPANTATLGGIYRRGA